MTLTLAGRLFRPLTPPKIQSFPSRHGAYGRSEPGTAYFVCDKPDAPFGEEIEDLEIIANGVSYNFHNAMLGWSQGDLELLIVSYGERGVF